MNWFRVFTNNGWRVFPEELSSPYMSKISTGRSVPEPVSESSIDLPGMISSNRGWQKISLDGLSLEIPTTDFSTFYEVLKEEPEEILPGDVTCIKLRGWLEGVVLTPTLRTELLTKMEEILPAVQVAAAKENREFVKALTEIQERSPIKIISQRQERLKAEGDSDVPKPN